MKPSNWFMYISTSNTPIKNAHFISIWWISQSIAIPIPQMHLIVINLAMGAKVSLKFTMGHLKRSFATNHFLYLTISHWCRTLIYILHSCNHFEGWSNLMYHWSCARHLLLLPCGLPFSCIFGSQRFIQPQIIQKCHIGHFFAVLE